MSYEKVKQAEHIAIGTKQTAKAVEQGTAREVIVARDADDRVTSKVLEMCRKSGLEVTYVDSRKKLGKACGIEVGAAVVAILANAER